MLIIDKKIIVAIFTLIAFCSLKISAQNEGEGKFSGLVFGDWYYFIENHNPELKDKRGFWFRRIYATYDYKIDKNFSTRIRLEMSNEGNFTSSVVIVPFIKDAWLSYSFSNQSLYLGISPTPTFPLLEKIWAYRMIEKTALDLQRMASTRDFGLAGLGSFDEEKILQYHVMFSNGSSNKQEIDKGKSALASLSIHPGKNFVFQIYGDYADNDGSEDWYTYQFVAGYISDLFNAGLQYANQNRKVNEAPDIKLRLASAFAFVNLSENFTLVSRVDKMFDQNPGGENIAFLPFDETAKSTLFIFAVDWHPIKEVKIIPNVEFITYSENEAFVTPGNDLVTRLTFYWEFK